MEKDFYTEQDPVYVGRTFYFNSESFHDEQVTCMSFEKEKVETYLSKVRGIPMVDTRNPKNDDLDYLMSELGDPGIVPVADIVQYSFRTIEEQNAFLKAHEWYYMQPHDGGIYRKYSSGLTKKEAKHIWVPVIVEKIIQEEWEHFRAEVTLSLHTLKELGYYMSTTKYAPRLFAAIEVVRQVENEIIRIDNAIEEKHPILFCGEPEYRARLKQEFERQQLDEQYRAKAFSVFDESF